MSETTSAVAPAPSNALPDASTVQLPVTAGQANSPNNNIQVADNLASAPQATHLTQSTLAATSQPIASISALVVEPGATPNSTTNVNMTEPTATSLLTLGAVPAVETKPGETTRPTVLLEDSDDDERDAPVDEPQNTLTKQFTEAEWKSLKEFRSQLPDVFADGYPDNPKAKDLPIVLWGVNINPHNPIDARVSVVLMKFLRARNLSVRDAREMLVSTLRWRESFGVEAAMKEEFPEDVFGKVGHIYGRDKGGRPVVYNLYGGNKALKAVFGDVQRFLRWRVVLMEKSITLLDFKETDQTVQVHDYEGVTLTSRDANSKNAASEATNIFQSHYPEFLHRKFFVNVPTLLNWIFWLFKPLISANTLAKMAVVGTSHHAMQKALLPVIDVKELPMRYGGDAEAF